MVKNSSKPMFALGGGINYFLDNYKKNMVNKTTKKDLEIIF